MKSAFISVTLLLCLSSVSHAARLDTSFSFSTIETPHFSIHYHQGLEAVARKAAVFAEEAHGNLTREFSRRPDGKTEMVLIDDSDFMNGFATALPYNIIYIQTVPPGITSTLGEYDDWLKVVITHEYAHIVTLDPSRGYWNVTRSIFGKPIPGMDPLSQLLFLVTAPPNTFLPRWWHEGMATWAETEYTGVGRGRSSYFDMIFRMAVADNNFPTVDRMNGDVPDWPAGNIPYIFGYRLQKYIADTYGKESLGKLNIAHSGRFPYLISAPPQELFGGKSYRDLYNDMIAALKRDESERIAILSALPFTRTSTVSKRGEMLTNPRFSPDGSRIAFTRRDPHDHATTVVTDRSGNSVLAEFRRLYSDGSNCWSPDGGSLYFTQAEINNGFNVYQDLYVYDIAHDSISRLTHGQRLGDADLSPDGRKFAAVVSSRGSQNLVLLELPGPGVEMKPRPVTDYSLQRVSSPRWSPDALKISYAVTDNSGRSAIHLYDVASGRDHTLFTVSHTAAYPVWSRDGSYLIYVSDETGVFNLFAYDLKEGKSRQVSHLLGGGGCSRTSRQTAGRSSSPATIRTASASHRCRSTGKNGRQNGGLCWRRFARCRYRPEAVKKLRAQARAGRRERPHPTVPSIPSFPTSGCRESPVTVRAKRFSDCSPQVRTCSVTTAMRSPPITAREGSAAISTLPGRTITFTRPSS